jgi:hypothetical protein
MKQHGIGIAIGIFAIIIIGMFTFAFLKKNELEQKAPDTVPTTTPLTTSPYDSITRIDAKHFITGTSHTAVGEVMLPTVCDLLNWEALVRESMPEGVTLAFTIINNAENCEQAIQPQRFVVTWNSSSEATIDATLNGRKVELNLIPALPGETPEDFELYLKG